MSNDWIFYTQILSLFTYVGVALGLYALLVKQKDATIQFLEKQLEAAKEDSSDIVLKRLSDRVQIARDEMERLSNDKDTLVGLNKKATTYIGSLEGVIAADKALIESLEEYRQEALQFRPLRKFFGEVLEHLSSAGKTIVVHRGDDDALLGVTITPPHK